MEFIVPLTFPTRIFDEPASTVSVFVATVLFFADEFFERDLGSLVLETEMVIVFPSIAVIVPTVKLGCGRTCDDNLFGPFAAKAIWLADRLATMAIATNAGKNLMVFIIIC